ncbi:hypothetical protein [Sphingobium sp. BS19]|uniref:hypothetical protein n=1 Tax=Sphingobium sp. BS19 TaxID=3018973 RepID=UPI00249215ED|nr:hypothetical protein [Sphingobium sp. BS19]
MPMRICVHPHESIDLGQTDIWLGVHVDTRHMPRVRAVMDAVVEALRSNSAILVPGS